VEERLAGFAERARAFTAVPGAKPWRAGRKK